MVEGLEITLSPLSSVDPVFKETVYSWTLLLDPLGCVDYGW